MALIECEDCGKQVSNRAPACVNCGAPIAEALPVVAPSRVTVEGETFVGTKALLVQLAVKAVQAVGYKVDAADEGSGLVSFTTGMTWGSWSGVSGSIYFESLGDNRFETTGNAKQNVKGGQVIALDLFGEAAAKVNKVVEEMRRLAKAA